MWNIAVLGVAHPHVQYVFDELQHQDQGTFAVVGIHDPDQTAAQRYATQLDVPTYANPADLLAESPDIAVVAGIYAARGQMVIDALNAGAHVLADKPLCTDLAELAQIEATAQATGKTVSLMLEKRGYPETLAARQLVERGDLGEILGITSTGPHKIKYADRPAWFLDRATYGGILNDLTVHDLDAALLFSGATSGTITAAQTGPLPGHPSFPTYGSATLTTPSAITTSEVSWLTPAAAELHGDYRMRLTGSEGIAEIFWARGRVELTTNTAAFHEVPLPAGLRPAEEALRAFAAGGTPQVGTAPSIDATRLALLAQLSADQGGTRQQWQAAASASSAAPNREAAQPN